MLGLHARPLSVAVFALALVSLVGCGSTGLIERDFDWDTDPQIARQLVERSAEAHGGDLFSQATDLSVAYEGEWGFFAPKVQPLMADPKYRSASEERYFLREGDVVQWHQGPAGTKTVLRARDSISVAYNREWIDQEKPELASAVVADVYVMLSTGPSFFLRSGVSLDSAPAERLDGEFYDVVHARLQPGFGVSAEDRAKLWIDRETRYLHRVQFTLEGYPPTRGAEVDVIFSDHREIDGYIWPTTFVERIREPFDVFAHRWRLVGLDLDRGLTASDFTLEPSARAARPARRLDDGDA